MTWNQNYLKANKQRLYNKHSCIEREIQLLSVCKRIPAFILKLKKQVSLNVHIFFSAAKIWTANSARGNEKVADPCLKGSRTCGYKLSWKKRFWNLWKDRNSPTDLFILILCVCARACVCVCVHVCIVRACMYVLCVRVYVCIVCVYRFHQTQIHHY
jgi:hypothetical protein